METSAVTRTFAREYRYDGDGRVRYYERDRDPKDLAPIGPTAEKWREFLGSSVYADLDLVDAPPGLQASAIRRYVHAADGRLVAWFDTPDTAHPAGRWHYVHADMLGTTRLVTDGAGNVGSGLAWTALGELAGAAFPGGPAATSRYGYCSGWGYEDDTLPVLAGGPADPAAGLGLLHVGARWYAPRLGRFVQRDPIAIADGANTYNYVRSCPIVGADPSGYFSLIELVHCAAIGASAGALGGLAHPSNFDGSATAWSVVGNVFAGALNGAAQGAGGVFGFIGGAVAGGLTGAGIAIVNGDTWAQVGMATGMGALGGLLSGSVKGDDLAAEDLLTVFLASGDANLLSNFFHWGMGK